MLGEAQTKVHTETILCVRRDHLSPPFPMVRARHPPREEDQKEEVLVETIRNSFDRRPPNLERILSEDSSGGQSAAASEGSQPELENSDFIFAMRFREKLSLPEQFKAFLKDAEVSKLKSGLSAADARYCSSQAGSVLISSQLQSAIFLGTGDDNIVSLCRCIEIDTEVDSSDIAYDYYLIAKYLEVDFDIPSVVLFSSIDPEIMNSPFNYGSHSSGSIEPDDILNEEDFVMVHAEDAGPKLEYPVDPEHEKWAHHDIPPLKINILVIGSRGDVQPFIAFGMGLMEYGHQVRLSTHECFRSIVTKHGLDFFPLAGNPKDLMDFMVRHPEMITIDTKEISTNRGIMNQIFRSCWDSCNFDEHGGCYMPDVLISNPPVQVHVHIAEKLQIPLQIHFTMPWSPTNDFPIPLHTYGVGIYGNRKSYTALSLLIWFGMRDIINEFRTNIGLPTMNLGYSLPETYNIPHIYCFSSHLVPRPSDWPDHIKICGFWFLETDLSYKPDQPLIDFLDKSSDPDKKIIYIGFGSISGVNPEELTKKIFAAVESAGVKAVVSAGWLGLKGGVTPSNIHMIGECPHEWLFPKMDGVVHHGGAGTTACGLKHGIPTLIVPFFGDQPFWGDIVARAEAGPKPIPHASLTASRFAKGITDLLSPKFKEKAMAVGEQIRNENGVAVACRWFHYFLPLTTNRMWECRVRTYEKKTLGMWSPLTEFPPEILFDKETLEDRMKNTPEWKWKGDWNRKEDGYGYEYSVSLNSKRWLPADSNCYYRRKTIIRHKVKVGLSDGDSAGNDEEPVAEVWEFQRVTGSVVRHTQWVDRAFNRLRVNDPEQILPPMGWQWAPHSKWEVDCTLGTESTRHWQYAFDTRARWKNERPWRVYYVKRRRYTRKKCKLDGATGPPQSQCDEVHKEAKDRRRMSGIKRIFTHTMKKVGLFPDENEPAYGDTLVEGTSTVRSREPSPLPRAGIIN